MLFLKKFKKRTRGDNPSRQRFNNLSDLSTTDLSLCHREVFLFKTKQRNIAHNSLLVFKNRLTFSKNFLSTLCSVFILFVCFIHSSVSFIATIAKFTLGFCGGFKLYTALNANLCWCIRNRNVVFFCLLSHIISI